MESLLRAELEILFFSSLNAVAFHLSGYVAISYRTHTLSISLADEDGAWVSHASPFPLRTPPMPIPCRFWNSKGLMLSSLLVEISLAIVGLLIDLVRDSITGSLNSCAEGGVAVFGDCLVGFLGSSCGGALDGLGDVVGGVPRSEKCQYRQGGELRW